MRARFEKVSVDPARSFHVREQRLGHFNAPWHFHPELELTLIVESRGRRFVGDNIEPFAEGDLVLLGPNLPHFWHNEGNQPAGTRAHSVVVQFRADFLGTELFEKPELAAAKRLLHRAARGLQFTGPTARSVAGRLQRLPQLDRFTALVELLGILDELARGRGARPLASAAYEPRLDRETEQRLARVYTFLMKNFREPLSLAQIACVASMTPEAFSRYFKRTTGRNVSDFLTELRLDHAGGLLRSTTRRIGDIAADAGFATLSSFNRRFRARLGCTPRKYRRAFAEETPAPAAFVASTGGP